MISDLLALVGLIAALMPNFTDTFKLALLIFSLCCCVTSAVRGAVEKCNTNRAVCETIKEKSEEK